MRSWFCGKVDCNLDNIFLQSELDLVLKFIIYVKAVQPTVGTQKSMLVKDQIKFQMEFLSQLENLVQ